MKIKNTGIVCTIGPASENIVKELKEAGMSIARINGAFGIPKKEVLEELKKIGIPVLVDLPGERKKLKDPNINDEKLIEYSIKNKVNYVGLSYVKDANEIKKLKEKLKKHNIKVVAKVETKEALKNLNLIIEEGDVILIDRGDLGTDIGFENVPKHQINIIKKSNELNTPVIVATEMMMSTIVSTKPNCADVSDVYYAASHGADFVMLSEETTIGKDPIATVKIMKKILDAVE